MKAQHLRIQIKKLGVIAVDLTFPIFTLNVIDHFIPEKAQSYLKKSNLDITQLIEQVKISDYAPQTIIEFEHDGRDFKIWIE